MHACTVRIIGANPTRCAWRHPLIKLALRVIVLTVILQVSSMAFADEMILSMLILLTIALTAAAIVTWHADESLPAEASESSTPAAEREVFAAVKQDQARAVPYAPPR